MDKLAAGERVPGHRVDRTLDAVDRFRGNWRRYHRPDDVNHLLRLFRKVKMQRGYLLDYIAFGSSDSGWIWPYARRDQGGVGARPPEALRRVPSDRLASEGRDGSLAPLAEQTLYRFLTYEPSPEGLFEYAYFINELWATKASGREAEWLSLKPLVVRHKFDAVLRREAGRLVRVTKPNQYDPIAFPAASGGRVQFFAFQPGPWKRIVRVEMKVESNGDAGWKTVEVVASLTR